MTRKEAADKIREYRRLGDRVRAVEFLKDWKFYIGDKWPVILSSNTSMDGGDVEWETFLLGGVLPAGFAALSGLSAQHGTLHVSGPDRPCSE